MTRTFEDHTGSQVSIDTSGNVTRDGNCIGRVEQDTESHHWWAIEPHGLATAGAASMRSAANVLIVAITEK